MEGTEEVGAGMDEKEVRKENWHPCLHHSLTEQDLSSFFDHQQAEHFSCGNAVCMDGQWATGIPSKSQFCAGYNLFPLNPVSFTPISFIWIWGSQI